MDCADVLARLDELLCGDLYGTEAARVMLHIRRCYTCKEEYDSLKELLGECRETLRHPCPVDGLDLLLAHIETEQRMAELARARERRQAAAKLGAVDWPWRIARIGTAAVAAAILTLCVGSKPGPDPVELPRVLPRYLAGGEGRMLEPASASSRGLLKYAQNLERYLNIATSLAELDDKAEPQDGEPRLAADGP